MLGRLPHADQVVQALPTEDQTWARAAILVRCALRCRDLFTLPKTLIADADVHEQTVDAVLKETIRLVMTGRGLQAEFRRSQAFIEEITHRAEAAADAYESASDQMLKLAEAVPARAADFRRGEVFYSAAERCLLAVHSACQFSEPVQADIDACIYSEYIACADVCNCKDEAEDAVMADTERLAQSRSGASPGELMRQQLWRSKQPAEKVRQAASIVHSATSDSDPVPEDAAFFYNRKPDAHQKADRERLFERLENEDWWTSDA